MFDLCDESALPGWLFLERVNKHPWTDQTKSLAPEVHVIAKARRQARVGLFPRLLTQSARSGRSFQRLVPAPSCSHILVFLSLPWSLADVLVVTTF
jgi:hypothetical protein